MERQQLLLDYKHSLYLDGNKSFSFLPAVPETIHYIRPKANSDRSDTNVLSRWRGGSMPCSSVDAVVEWLPDPLNALAHLEMLEHVLMHALRALVSRRRIHSEHANYERKRFKRAICE